MCYIRYLVLIFEVDGDGGVVQKGRDPDAVAVSVVEVLERMGVVVQSQHLVPGVVGNAVTDTEATVHGFNARVRGGTATCGLDVNSREGATVHLCYVPEI